MTTSLVPEYRQRVAIENVKPEIDAGRFPIKRCLDEDILVHATIHTDGSDILDATLQYRFASANEWTEAPLTVLNAGKDLWEGRFKAETLGAGEYSIQAWIDTFRTWRYKLDKKATAGQDVRLDLLEGALLIDDAVSRASGKEASILKEYAKTFRDRSAMDRSIKSAMEDRLLVLMRRYASRKDATQYRVLPLRIERLRARTGAWYEFFPRSAGPSPERSATFKEAESRLPDIAQMGFDVLYLPPVHPIGESFRKGPNNNPQSKPGDLGSPWAIGSSAGGHIAVEPGLGTLADFDHFLHATTNLGMELALDLAYQCSPDHPYVKAHPEWFHRRPDGSIQYAENPPKKYEDIYPIDFECEDWKALWEELKNVVLFWAKRGVRIFRVDNPHTKPFRFWEWMIATVQAEYPETVFLAEAFTRPAVMQYLAKSGFTQSYTYFTWRNEAAELTEYLTELTQTDESDFLRPNLFVNTPDILHEYLQTGGRPAHVIRLILAATLSASYGMYGPPFELCESIAFPGTEDYVDSEKYQVRQWNLNQPQSLRGLITQINAIRRENPALHLNTNLRFYPVDNPQLICYGKATADGANRILVVVNLDPHNAQSGFVQVPTAEWALPDHYNVHDLLTQETFSWTGASNFVKLDPQVRSAHVLRITHAAQ